MKENEKYEKYEKYFTNLPGSFFVGYSDATVPFLKTLHIHDAFELTLILSDNVQVDVNEESYEVSRESLMVFNPLDLHRLYPADQTGFCRYVLWFKYDYLNEFEGLRDKLLKCFYCRVSERANYLNLSVQQHRELLSLYRRLLEAAQMQEAFDSDILVKIRLVELLVAVNHFYLPEQPLKEEASSDEHQAVYRVIQYIQEHLAEPLDQDYLAKLAYTDKRKLCSNFRIITGQSTGQYIINSRLTAAKALLVQGIPVSLVCEKTGFGDCCNFSRTFRKHVGLSPKQYALRYAEKAELG